MNYVEKVLHEKFNNTKIGSQHEIRNIEILNSDDINIYGKSNEGEPLLITLKFGNKCKDCWKLNITIGAYHYVYWNGYMTEMGEKIQYKAKKNFWFTKNEYITYGIDHFCDFSGNDMHIYNDLSWDLIQKSISGKKVIHYNTLSKDHSKWACKNNNITDQYVSINHSIYNINFDEYESSTGITSFKTSFSDLNLYIPNTSRQLITDVYMPADILDIVHLYRVMIHKRDTLC
jgi:hypothetical protein